MTSPPPFPAPIFQTARRISGHVVSEIPPEQAVTPTNSVAGNILLMEEAYYSLQRKIKDSMHGSVRVGFELNKMQDTGVYELVPNVRDKGYKMMTVQISRLQEDNIIEETINEVAALQWITNAAKENCHLLKPVVVGKDATHMYVISPYHHKEGSLFDYCGRVGRLSESEARFFFRQILQVSIIISTTIVRSSLHCCIFSSHTHVLKGTGRIKRIRIMSSGSRFRQRSFE